MTTVFSHGGDVERLARELDLPPGHFLDFSASVNPRGLPARARERLLRDAGDPILLARYPDRDAHELRAILSDQLRVSADCIVIGAGAAALIQSALGALAPQGCVIPTPAFSEYERACRAQRCAFRKVPRDQDTLACAAPGELLFFNNPHNPTGAILSRDEMLALLRRVQGPVILDEAFIDYAPEASVTEDAASTPNLIAIRSLTKFYGCPALRVGYAVTSPAIAQRMATQLAAWPVTTLAMNALAEALRDADFSSATIAQNARNRTTLSAGLGELGFRVFPPAANFLLIEVPAGCSAAQIRGSLLRDSAMLVRECESFDGLEGDHYLRVAVRTEDENARFIAALKRTLECCQRND